jgi:hypothetical protein
MDAGKGYPALVCGRRLRIDESLRRFQIDAEAIIQHGIKQRFPPAGFSPMLEQILAYILFLAVM